VPAKKAAGKVGYLQFVAAPPKEPPRLVVVAGKEPILADEVVAALVAAAVPDESMRALNVDLIDARASDDYGVIAEKTAAMPFLAPRRAVIVRGTIDLKKEERDEIVAAAADLAEQALLVIDHSGKPARPQGRKPMDEAAAFAKAVADSLLVDVTLNAAGCERYIESYAARLGVKLDTGAAGALASLENVTEIRNALDLLSLLKKQITEADVREYALPSSDVKFWDLAGAINEGKAGLALALAKELVSEPGDAIGPLIWLAGEQQIIWELRNGARGAEYAAATGQNAWRVNKLLGVGRDLTKKELKERVDMTMAALERSLTGRRQADQALEEVIVRLATKRDAVPRS
jgi:DNA polymerase III delta subunit